jgi:glutamate---cysteine ligase / carboxylate-amine ligase
VAQDTTSSPRRVHDPTTAPTFAYGGEFTLGAEEELLLVDADGMLTDVADDLLPRLAPRTPADARPSAEVYACEVEFDTPVSGTGADLVRSLAAARARVVDEGHRPLAVGVHPTAPLGDFRITRSARYDRIGAEFAGVFRTPTAAYQVHVGVPDAEVMVTVFRSLRNRLALFRGLAAGSPFWHGRDSGLASSRAVIMWSYPRVGVPPVFHSYDEFLTQAHAQLAAAEAPDHSYLWWDMRPQSRLGTVEIRVMDVTPSLDLAAGLATLAQGLAGYAVEGPPVVDMPAEVLRENDFRAARYGLDARIVDVDGNLRPLRELATVAVRQARAALGPGGSADPLDVVTAALTEETESERQRRVAGTGGLPAVLADLARRTRESSPGRVG